MDEGLDCRVCEHYEFIYEEYPDNEPVIVYSFHKCSAFDRIYFSVSELKDAYINCPRRSIRVGYGIPGEIINEIKAINLSFWQLLGERIDLIRVTTDQVTLMASPCYSYIDLASKVGVLASLVEMNIKELRKLVKNYEEDWKGLKLLEVLFKDRGKYSDDLERALKILRAAVMLRNKIPPYHPPSEREALKMAKRLGIQLTVTSQSEWQRNCEILLQKFLLAIRTIRIVLSDLATEEVS